MLRTHQARVHGNVTAAAIQGTTKPIVEGDQSASARRRRIFDSHTRLKPRMARRLLGSDSEEEYLPLPLSSSPTIELYCCLWHGCVQTFLFIEDLEAHVFNQHVPIREVSSRYFKKIYVYPLLSRSCIVIGLVVIVKNDFVFDNNLFRI